MKISKTKFKGLLLIEPIKNKDLRGSFTEVFRNDLLNDNLKFPISFCQDNLAYSKKNVLRGLHFQEEPYSQSKFLYVSFGEILDVVVDMRKNSSTYAKYFSIILSSENNKSILIPKGFAHGYLTLSEKAVVNYKVDNYYNKKYDKGFKYNDPNLNIDWKINPNDIIISEKDNNLDYFNW